MPLDETPVVHEDFQPHIRITTEEAIKIFEEMFEAEERVVFEQQWPNYNFIGVAGEDIDRYYKAKDKLATLQRLFPAHCMVAVRMLAHKHAGV